MSEEYCFGREQFENPRVGCCGLVRKDQLYPIGYNPKLDRFKKEAISIMEKYISKKDDVWFIEQYMDISFGDLRGNGKAIYEFYLDKKSKEWAFYENGNKIFSVQTVQELKEKW